MKSDIAYYYGKLISALYLVVRTYEYVLLPVLSETINNATDDNSLIPLDRQEQLLTGLTEITNGIGRLIDVYNSLPKK